MTTFQLQSSLLPNPAAANKPSLPTDEDAYDLKLVEAIRRGEAAAWPALIARYQDRLFSTCLRMVHNVGTWRPTWPRTRSSRSFRGSSRSTAGARAFHLDDPDHHERVSPFEASFREAEAARRASRASRRKQRHPTEILSRRGDFEQVREPGLSSGVEAHEDQERVLSALRQLDPDQRAVLILSAIAAGTRLRAELPRSSGWLWGPSRAGCSGRGRR